MRWVTVVAVLGIAMGANPRFVDSKIVVSRHAWIGAIKGEPLMRGVFDSKAPSGSLTDGFAVYCDVATDEWMLTNKAGETVNLSKSLLIPPPPMKIYDCEKVTR